MLHNPIATHPAWPHQSHHPHSHGASPSSRARHGARWHPYESGAGNGVLAGGPAGDKAEGAGDRACSPGVKRRLHITIPGKACMRSRSLTDIHSSGALAPSPLRNCAAYDEAGLPVRVGQVYESQVESVHMPGMKRAQSYYPVAAPQYVPTPTTARQGSLHTPPTVTTRNAYSMSTPSSSYGGTPLGANTPATTIMTTPATSITVTPASAISPVSPIRARFSFPMTHGPMAFGEGAAARVTVPEPEERCAIEESWKVQGGGGWGGQEGSGMETEDDARTEVGSPEIGVTEEEVYGVRPISDVRLPPVRSFMPPAAYPLSGAAAQQTRRAMRVSAVPQDVLLYGPAGVTPAPAELARNNACDKLPPIPSMVPPRQATFFGIQNVPVVDGSGRFATMCAPGQRPMPARPVYPPAALAPLIASHVGLPHGGLTAPIERGDEMIQWKETQRAKERGDIVVKDGELTVAERLEMEKRVSMSVKVINHIYYGADDLPKTRSPAQPTRRLPEEVSSRADMASASSSRTGSVREAYWPPTPSSMPSSPESPKTRRDRQRASMRKDVFGERVVPAPKSELEEMVRAIGSPGLASDEQEQEEEADPAREPPARTLTWFVTEVLRRSRTSINVLQVALAYLAGAKPEIHTQLRAAADRQAELALQIAGLPQHVRDALPGMDWLGSEFTPSPLIDPRRTFLASLVLASKFLLDKAFSNKAWAKLSGLEALEVGKCERALGTALNWRLWVGREASRETHLDHAPAPPPPSLLSPAVYPAPLRSMVHENPLLSRVQDAVSPARSSSPYGSQVTSRSTPTLDSSSDLGSDSGVLPGFDEVSQFTHTPEVYAFAGEVMVGAEEEMLHRSPESGYLRAATAGSMRLASDAGANSRPTLPPIRSFDRPALRHGPSEIATPQTDSNMGCGHVPSICLDRPSANEAPLAYANLGRPWEAVQQPHWDFVHDGVVGE